MTNHNSTACSLVHLPCPCHIVLNHFFYTSPLVKAATGEVVTSEDLGGAEVHCSSSGVSDYYARDEIEGLRIARDIFLSLNQKRIDDVKRNDWEEPLFPAKELGGIIPVDPKQPFDVRLIIARILDGSRFQEYKAKYGKTIVTGFGELHGIKVGIIANNGILFSESSLKAANFVEICAQRGIPILFLQVSEDAIFYLHRCCIL